MTHFSDYLDNQNYSWESFDSITSVITVSDTDSDRTILYSDMDTDIGVETTETNKTADVGDYVRGNTNGSVAGPGKDLIYSPKYL